LDRRPAGFATEIKAPAAFTYPLPDDFPI